MLNHYQIVWHNSNYYGRYIGEIPVPKRKAMINNH